MKKKRTPLLLLVYNRPRYTENVLRSLSDCRRLDEVDVFIHCDGPVDADDAIAVEATRQCVRDWNEKYPADVTMQAENHGLFYSVTGEVTRLCAEYGRVIVVEDDLTLSPFFIDYMLNALDKYEHAERIYQISGYMFPFEMKSVPPAFFLNFATTWGWATWQRAWRNFDGDMRELPDELKRWWVRRRFDLGNAYPYTRLLRERLAGRNSSWGILWWWTIFRNRALTLFPAKSFVNRGGVDDSGTHSSSDDPYAWQEEDNISRSPLRFDDLPDLQEESRRAARTIRKFILKKRIG